MRRFTMLLTIMTFIVGSSLAQTTVTRGFSRMERADESLSGPLTLAAGTYAVFHTSDGEFIAQLLPKDAPKAVENFVGLATGTKRWQHPVTRIDNTTPLYNNTTIYQVAEDVVIRGGDPINKGAGGPGYVLDLETNPKLNFDRPGRLAMQNDGDKASGSRWFVALSPFPDWSGKLTIFGQIIGGMEVVRAISAKPTKRPFVPLEPTLVSSVEIVEVPAGQQTTASFAVENGKKMVTLDKDFKATPEAAAAAAAAEITTTTTQTSDTLTSLTETTSGTATTSDTAETTKTAKKQ